MLRRFANSLNQPRPIHRAAIRHSRNQSRHLQRRHSDKSLSDRSVGCVPITPLLHRRRRGTGCRSSRSHPRFNLCFITFLSLSHPILHPLPPWHRSGVFSRQNGFFLRIHQHPLPEPNPTPHLAHRFDTRADAELIKESVTRHRQSALQRNIALAVWIPVVPSSPCHFNGTWAVNNRLGGEISFRILQCRQRGKGLECRSRGISP